MVDAERNSGPLQSRAMRHGELFPPLPVAQAPIHGLAHSRACSPRVCYGNGQRSSLNGFVAQRPVARSVFLDASFESSLCALDQAFAHSSVVRYCAGAPAGLAILPLLAFGTTARSDRRQLQRAGKPPLSTLLSPSDLTVGCVSFSSSATCALCPSCYLPLSQWRHHSRMCTAR